MEELATKYSFKDIEEKHYCCWEQKKLFHAAINKNKPVFTIMIPPPNVTGILHMGHALNNTIQDILIRYHKLKGFEALWMPGTDHAGIATQNVVERKLAKSGTTRQDLGREKFLEHVWQWKQEYGSTIIRQLKRLGCACDWDRERFTMDEAYSDAVLEVFIRLYEKGLIYRGYYIINWCPRCETALSDEEAPHKDVPGFLYHIKYPIKGTKDFIVVATTRPETMLGDTAVAVNPEDERYRHLIGKKIILPLLDREIPVISDELVDPKFGTGAVKVTPAHDPNDYVMGRRHDLEFINIFHPNGVCNENAADYAGLDRFEAREAVLEDLKERKLLEKIEPHQHAVGHCYRCHSVIEPYYSKQWFVKMKPLAKPGIEAVVNGEIKFYPDRWTKVYLNWMENIQDWCISRQIWWGHRLPVYYCAKCQETDDKKGVVVAREKPRVCPDCGSGEMVQDEDVLDTWFSSWLWPFATFGWPFEKKSTDNSPQSTEIKEQELKYFYPTSVLVTAPEIIFFWVARMIMSGFEFMGKIPFKDVYIHGTVRDDTGKKMSKSLGNSIDPLEIISEYGTDALRFSLISISSMGQDVYLAKEKFEFGRNFCNKIWNASRFILMNLDRGCLDPEHPMDFKAEDLGIAEHWILGNLCRAAAEIDKALVNYRLNEATAIIYDFFWHQFCDWYIELAKLKIKEPGTQKVLYAVLDYALRLLHPFMPFISEEIWQKLTLKSQPILLESMPRLPGMINAQSGEKVEKIISLLTLVRNLRSERKIAPKESVEIFIFDTNNVFAGILGEHGNYVMSLARVSKINFLSAENAPAGSVGSGVTLGCVVHICAQTVQDLESEKLKISAQIAQVRDFITRKDKLLNNAQYVAKAPEAVVAKERESRRQLQEELDKLLRIQDDLEKK